jgi:ATP-dependent Clp protease, protease subunit
MVHWRDSVPGEPDRPADPGGGWSPAEQALLERRIILISGSLDVARASHLAACLINLEISSGEPIEMRVNAESDSLDAAFGLMDTIDNLGVPVHATVAGLAGGTVVGVVGVCRRRRIGAMGRIHLREPHADFFGGASELSRRAADLQSRVEAYARRLAEATGRPFEHIEADMRSGRHFDAEGALAYGLVDEILGRPGPPPST